MRRRFDYPEGATFKEIRYIYNKWYRQTHPQIYRDAQAKQRRLYKDKVEARRQAWMKRNPDKMKAIYNRASKKCSEKYPNRTWKYVLVNKYGLTVEKYEVMLAGQNGVCAICLQTDPSKRRLAVDHCHTTGKVRGLLCGHCNMMLGRHSDNPIMFDRAAEYLRRHAL